MKYFKFYLSLISIVLLFSTCHKESIEEVKAVNINEQIELNLQKITIYNGLSGTVYLKDGNCMPMIDGSNTCQTYPIKRKILFYEPTYISQVEDYGPEFSNVPTRKIAETESDADGFYEISLAPGNYSVFILENDHFYANYFSGEGIINQVEISNDSLTIAHHVVDYAVY